MPFWTAVDGRTNDPKRESRFKVEIASLNNGGAVWYAKSFTKPSATIKTTAHRYLNHSFNYPGSVEWGDVTIELVDPTDPIDAAGSLAQLLAAMGYVVPSSPSALDVTAENVDLSTISKRKGTASLGVVIVSHLDDEGQEIETWQLQQAFVTKFEWGSLKYESDNLNVLKLTLKYDWATCLINNNELTATTAVSAVGSDVAGTYFDKGQKGIKTT